MNCELNIDGIASLSKAIKDIIENDSNSNIPKAALDNNLRKAAKSIAKEYSKKLGSTAVQRALVEKVNAKVRNAIEHKSNTSSSTDTRSSDTISNDDNYINDDDNLWHDNWDSVDNVSDEEYMAALMDDDSQMADDLASIVAETIKPEGLKSIENEIVAIQEEIDAVDNVINDVSNDQYGILDKIKRLKEEAKKLYGKDGAEYKDLFKQLSETIANVENELNTIGIGKETDTTKIKNKIMAALQSSDNTGLRKAGLAMYKAVSAIQKLGQNIYEKVAEVYSHVEKLWSTRDKAIGDKKAIKALDRKFKAYKNIVNSMSARNGRLEAIRNSLQKKQKVTASKATGNVSGDKIAANGVYSSEINQYGKNIMSIFGIGSNNRVYGSGGELSANMKSKLKEKGLLDSGVTRYTDPEELVKAYMTDNIVESKKKGSWLNAFGIKPGSMLETIGNSVTESLSKIPAVGKAIAFTDKEGNRKSIINDLVDMVNAPAKGVIFNRDGTVNAEVAVAIGLAQMEYMRENAGTQNSAEDVARMLGKNDGSEVTEQEMLAYSSGELRNQLAMKMGRKILGIAGLRIKDSASEEAAGKMIESMGLYAIANGIDRGIFKSRSIDIKEFGEMRGKDANAITNEGAKINFIEVDASGHNVLETNRGNLTRAEKELGPDSGMELVEYTVPKNRERLRNAKVAGQKATKVQEDKAEELEHTKWGVNTEGYDYLMEKVGVDRLRKLMKYKSKEEIADMPYRDANSATSKNREIDRSIEALIDLKNDLKSRKNPWFHFKYFISRNGRFFIDNALINPQTDKLHRFIVQARGTMGRMVSKDDVEFKKFIVQAFGIGDDKLGSRSAVKIADSILGADIAELEKIFDGEIVIDGNKLEAEHPSHTAMAITEIIKWKATKDGEQFKSNMLGEFDAVTSGFALKMLQFPVMDIKEVKEWLRKTGIFMDGEQSKSMGQMIEDGEIVDAYISNADEIKELNSGDVAGMVLSTFNKEKGEFEEKPVDPHKLFKFAAGLMKPVREDDKVTKYTRNYIVKPAFMVFNYGASLFNIERTIGREVVKDFGQKLLDVEAGSAGLGLLKTAMMNNNVGKDGKVTALTEEDFNKLLKTTDIRSIKTRIGNETINVNQYLVDVIGNTYGKQLTKGFERKFGDIIEANNVVSASTKFTFRLWEKAYALKKAELLASNKVDNAKNINVLQTELRKLESTVKDSRYVADKTKNTRKLNSIKGKIAVLEAASSEVLTKEDNDAIVSSLIKMFPMVKVHTGAEEDVSDGVALAGATASHNTSDKAIINYGGKETSGFTTGEELTESAAGAVVLPIHYIDGTLMTLTLDSDMLGVHDAKVVGVGDGEKASKDYNKAVYDVGKNYNLVKELLNTTTRSMDEFESTFGTKALDASIKEVDSDNAKKFESKTKDAIRTKTQRGDKLVSTAQTFVGALQEMQDLDAVVTKARKELFNRISSVDHMIAMDGSRYEVSGKTKNSEKSAQLEIDKATEPVTISEFIGKYMPKMDKAASIKSIENIISKLGIPLDVTKAKITFSTDKSEYFGTMDKTSKDITVYVRNNKPEDSMQHTLAHEFVHRLTETAMAKVATDFMKGVNSAEVASFNRLEKMTNKLRKEYTKRIASGSIDIGTASDLTQGLEESASDDILDRVDAVSEFMAEMASNDKLQKLAEDVGMFGKIRAELKVIFGKVFGKDSGPTNMYEQALSETAYMMKRSAELEEKANKKEGC